MKQIITLLAILTMLGCQSRKKRTMLAQQTLTEKTQADTVRTAAEKDSVVAVVKKSKNKTKTEKKNEGEVEIKAKVDSAQDFHFDNVVSGDTLSSIHVSGNAEVKIKTNWKDNHVDERLDKVEEKLDMVAKLARQAVSQKTIKEIAAKVKETNKNVTAKNFTFGAWATWLAAFVAVACLVWLFLYFGGRINLKK